MKFLLVLFLLTVNVLAFGVRFEIDGKDGWTARIRFEDPEKVSTPVFIVITDGKKITNTEALAGVKDMQELALGLPDGGYDVTISDGGNRVLLKEQFELKTPFLAKLTDVGQDSFGFSVTPGARLAVAWKLTAEDKKTEVRSGSAGDSATNIRAGDLEPGTAYRLEIISGNYSRALLFRTGYRNAALNRPVTGNFTRQPASKFIDDSSPAITRVNDGRLEWLSGMAASGEVNSGDQYVYIRLEKKTSVRTIRVYWHAYYYPSSYFLLYGMDGKTWKSVRRNAVNFRDGKAPDNTPVKVDEFAPDADNDSAAYVGLVVKKGTKLMNRDMTRNYVELMELEVYE